MLTQLVQRRTMTHKLADSQRQKKKKIMQEGDLDQTTAGILSYEEVKGVMEEDV